MGDRVGIVGHPHVPRIGSADAVDVAAAWCRRSVLNGGWHRSEQMAPFGADGTVRTSTGFGTPFAFITDSRGLTGLSSNPVDRIRNKCCKMQHLQPETRSEGLGERRFFS